MSDPKAIVLEFISDSFDALENLNTSLVELEKDPGNEELINSVFRDFHNMKGGASYLKLENLTKILHLSEEVLDGVRDEDIELSADLTDLLLKAVDTTESLLKYLKENGEESDEFPQELFDQLNKYVA